MKENKKQSLFMKWWFWVILAFVCIIFISQISEDNKSKIVNYTIEKEYLNEFGENYKINLIDACIMAEVFVEKNLKSPSTAKFPACSTQKINYKGNQTYYVHSYVDSQNGFGAMIRTRYSVELKDAMYDMWNLVDIEFY
jgi:hypothetical protein